MTVPSKHTHYGCVPFHHCQSRFMPLVNLTYTMSALPLFNLDGSFVHLVSCYMEQSRQKMIDPPVVLSFQVHYFQVSVESFNGHISVRGSANTITICPLLDPFQYQFWKYSANLFNSGSDIIQLTVCWSACLNSLGFKISIKVRMWWYTSTCFSFLHIMLFRFVLQALSTCQQQRSFLGFPM